MRRHCAGHTLIFREMAAAMPPTVLSSVLLFTARKRSCGKVMFSQVSVCHSAGGVSMWPLPMMHPDMGIPFPTPPSCPLPLRYRHPVVAIKTRTVGKWAVLILMECRFFLRKIYAFRATNYRCYQLIYWKRLLLKTYSRQTDWTH